MFTSPQAPKAPYVVSHFSREITNDFCCQFWPLEATPILASDHATTFNIADVTRGHTQFRPREGVPPPQLAFYDPVLAPTTTVNTAVEASERRRKTDANFACPVPGCGSTFTRHFNLKGALSRPLRECSWC
jgi:hypothetical protein